MGADPLVLHVDGWKLQININDYGARIIIITDEVPNSSHYVDLTIALADELRAYLDSYLPVVP